MKGFAFVIFGINIFDFQILVIITRSTVKLCCNNHYLNVSNSGSFIVTIALQQPKFSIPSSPVCFCLIVQFSFVFFVYLPLNQISDNYLIADSKSISTKNISQKNNPEKSLHQFIYQFFIDQFILRSQSQLNFVATKNILKMAALYFLSKRLNAANLVHVGFE